MDAFREQARVEDSTRIFSARRLARLLILGTVFFLVPLFGSTENAFAPPDPPVNLVPPGISGTPENGETLTVIPGQWQNGSIIGYQWQVCGSLIVCINIDDATETTYVVGDDEVGSQLVVVETACTDLAGCASSTSAPTAVIDGGQINGYAASGTATNQNLGIRYLCQNLGTNPNDEHDPMNGCKGLGANFKNCCNGEPLLGGRADMKASSYSWWSPENHFGAQRVAAEGGYLSAPNFLEQTLIQGGFAKMNGLPLNDDPLCNTAQTKRKFAETGWNTPNTDGWEYACQFFDEVPPNEHVVVRVSNRGQADWSVYLDGLQVFNHEDSMARASILYVGGEFSTRQVRCILNCSNVSTGCASAGYGVDGTLRWQRAREPNFGDPFTIQSSWLRNNKNKWVIGSVSGGFWIRNRASCGT